MGQRLLGFTTVVRVMETNRWNTIKTDGVKKCLLMQPTNRVQTAFKGWHSCTFQALSRLLNQNVQTLRAFIIGRFYPDRGTKDRGRCLCSDRKPTEAMWLGFKAIKIELIWSDYHHIYILMRLWKTKFFIDSVPTAINVIIISFVFF